MGFFDSIKNIMSIPEEDDYDEEIEELLIKLLYHP